MGEWPLWGKIFIFLGLFFLLVGLIIVVGGKVFPLGRLPGDFVIRRDNFVFYFPLMSGIILSVILSVILNIIFRH